MKAGAIAFFTYQLNNYSGAAYQALEIAREIDDLSFVFFNQDAKAKIGWKRIFPNAVVFNLPRNKIIQILIIFFATFVFRIRIYHLHGFIMIGLLAGMLLNRRIILKSTLVGDDDLESVSKSRWGSLKIWALKRVALNIVLSEALRELNKKYVASEKILKIPNGVAIAEGPAPAKKGSIFCTVGVISPRKRTYDAIAYFKDNYAILPGTKMYVVGPDSPSDELRELDEEYVKKCVNLANDGHGEKIIFTGRLTREKTKEVFRESKGFIFFSEQEGMPNVLLEAMAQNCVPIVTPIGGVSREIIENARDGFIIESTKEAIRIEDVDAILAASAPMEKVKTLFRIGVIAAKYRALYSSMA